MKKILKALWQFCSYMFVPQWGRNKKRCRQVGHGTIGLRATSNSDMAACRFLEMV